MTDSQRPDHFVYLLRCGDETLYTGYTTDVERRVREHACGDGAKYTRGRTPLELVHVESFASQSAAMRREYALKQHTRPEKERVVEDGGVPDWIGLSDELVGAKARSE